MRHYTLPPKKTYKISKYIPPFGGLFRTEQPMKFYETSSAKLYGERNRLMTAGEVEILEDIDEPVNDHHGEFSYFFKEAWLEIGIAFLLIAEVVIMLFEWRKL